MLGALVCLCLGIAYAFGSFVLPGMQFSQRWMGLGIGLVVIGTSMICAYVAENGRRDRKEDDKDSHTGEGHEG